MPPKVIMVLGWVIFLALDFQCTLPPMAKPIIAGESKWSGYIQPTMWEARDLPLEEIGVGWLVYACSRCSPSNAHLWIHINLEKLENEARLWVTLVATSKSLFFLLCLGRLHFLTLHKLYNLPKQFRTSYKQVYIWNITWSLKSEPHSTQPIT